MFDFPSIGAVGIRTTTITVNELTGALVIGEGILAGIRETTKFEDEDALAAAYDSFTDQFETSEGGSIKAGREEAEAMEDDELGQEQIVKQKRG